MSDEINPRVLRQAQRQALILIDKIKAEYTKRNLRTYRELEDKYAMPLPGFSEEAKDQPIISSIFLRPIFDAYYNGTEERLKRALAGQENKRRLKPTPEAECYKFKHSDARLLPAQDAAFRAMREEMLYGKKYRACLQNGITGSGKTAIIAALCDVIIDENLYKPAGLPITPTFPILIFTVKNAKESTERSFRDKFGLGPYLDDGRIKVFSYSSIGTSAGIGTLVDVQELYNPVDDSTTIDYTWKAMAISRFAFFDECHKTARRDARITKLVRKLDAAARQYPIFETQFFFFSATPFERVNDAETFVCMADIEFNGQKITYNNFNINFANVIAPSGPHLPNKSAAEKLFRAIAHQVYEMPHVPWKHKMYNACRFYGFLRHEQRLQYDNAIDEYLERIKTLGRETPSDRAMRYIALGQLRKKGEPIRCEQIAMEMHDDLENGRSPILACAFTGTVIKTIFLLIDQFGYKREDISVIWGGRDDCRPERILTPQDLIDITAKAMADGEIDAKTRRLIQKNLAWNEDRLLFQDESREAQDDRYKRLKSLGLIGGQSQAVRELEIIRFQTGQSRICIYTTAAGGTGLSLEHNHPATCQRKLYATPIYNGKEFVQALGRAHRIVSLSDTYQFVCLLRGTIEETHVAPNLDNKLQSMSAIGSRKMDIGMVLANLDAQAFLHGRTDGHVKDISEVIAATNADDHSQEVGSSDDDDDDDE